MTTDQTAGTPRKTILVVEDDELVREVVCAMLSEHYTLLVARDGVEALELYALHSSQLQGVITDWRMPQKNGAAVVAHIRQENTSLPILVMSGDLSIQEAERLKRDARVSLIRKPFLETDLLKALSEW